MKKGPDTDAENHQKIKMLVKIGDVEPEEWITYNELCNIIEGQLGAEQGHPSRIQTHKDI